MNILRISLGLILLLVVCLQDDSAQPVTKPPLAYSPPTDAWRTECVDCPHGFFWLNGRGLHLDGSGQPHIAYGGDNLYHAWFDGESWNTEIADSNANTGERASLALDLGGRPHIAYTLDWPGAYQLRYAYKDAGGWHTQTVAVSGQDFGDLSLGISADYHIHIVYYQDNALQYAFQDAGGWHFQTIDSSSGAVGQFPSLALDAAGFPHTSYFDIDAYHLRYAYRDADGWHIQVVDAGGIGSSLALDGDGCAHISFLDRINLTAMYARQESCPAGSSWHFETLGAIGLYADEYTSLALDDKNRPHIAYLNGAGGSLNYTFHDDAGWHPQILVSGLLELSGTSLDLNGGDVPHIAYVDYPYLYDIHQVSADWEPEEVDRSIAIGVDSSLAIDAGGRLHTAYFRDSMLVYTAQTQVGWQSQGVPGVTSENFNLALDSQGYPHFCHYGGNISYTYLDASGWHTVILDQEAVGWDPCSIAIDSQDYAHIIYQRVYPMIDESYYYIYQDAAGWHSTQLPVTGRHDLVLDAGDSPHILFENDSLTYLQQDENGWSQTAVISGTFTHAALALDAEGYAHISYYDYTAGDLRYTHQDAGGWHNETVDSAGDPGRYTDIAVDAQGHPHISYLDIVYPFTGNLKYAHLDGDGWHLQTVDTTYSTGFSTSIVLDEAGKPYIVYHNDATNDLMLAYTLPEALYLPLALRSR